MSARFAVALEAEEAKARLAELQARLGGLEPALDKLGVALANMVQRRFDLEQGPGGIPWKPSQRVLKKGGKTLILNKHLRNSITHRAQGNTLEVGTNTEYAAAHQFGAVIYRRAYIGTLRLRTDAKGNLERQGKEGPKANLAKFAKTRGSKAHKRFREVRYSVGNFAIILPARPFLGMDDQMEAHAVAELRNHIDVLDGRATA